MDNMNKMNKMKNTGQIINAINNNLEKFNIIGNLSQSITKAKTERQKIINNEIKEIYEIVFKNLCSKKIKTEFIYKDNFYYVCNTGISKKTNHDYYLNADNIGNEYFKDFGNQLVIIGNNQSYFLKVLSKQKKQIFKQFMKQVYLLKIVENSSIKFKEGEEITLNEYHDEYLYGYPNPKSPKITRKIMKKIVKEIKINEKGVELSYTEEENSPSLINTNKQQLKDFIFIEQIYIPIKKLLGIELKIKNKELENTKKFLEYLKSTFSSHLMFRELKKTS